MLSSKATIAQSSSGMSTAAVSVRNLKKILQVCLFAWKPYPFLPYDCDFYLE